MSFAVEDDSALTEAEEDADADADAEEDEEALAEEDDDPFEEEDVDGRDVFPVPFPLRLGFGLIG